MVDLVGEGFDAAIRIAILPDSSLVARRLCARCHATPWPRRHTSSATGGPRIRCTSRQHKWLGYAYLTTPGVLHYTSSSGEQASVRPAGPLRVNNGEALMPALLAGLGIADLPEFIVGDAVTSGALEVILKGWKLREGAVHLGLAIKRPATRPRRASGGFPGQAFQRREKAEGEAPQCGVPPDVTAERAANVALQRRACKC